MPITLARFQRKHATHATHASMLPSQLRQPRHPDKLPTNTIYASKNSTSFLKLVRSSFDLYFEQKIIITKRHLQVYASYMLFKT